MFKRVSSKNLDDWELKLFWLFYSQLKKHTDTFGFLLLKFNFDFQINLFCVFELGQMKITNFSF